MPIQYTNKKSQTFYLHQGTTKTGKPKYFFSMKSEGTLVDKVPDGFEIYENPNAQVFLRRIQPKIVTDEEVALVEQGMRQISRLQYYQIDVKKNTIIIFEANQDVEALSEILKFAHRAKEVGTENLLTQLISYSPVLHFVLVDEEKRWFKTERYCFLGSVDDWITIGKVDKLQNLVRKYVKHLGQESYYELY
jgi:hypothetical protein